MKVARLVGISYSSTRMKGAGSTMVIKTCKKLYRENHLVDKVGFPSGLFTSVLQERAQSTLSLSCADQAGHEGCCKHFIN